LSERYVRKALEALVSAGVLHSLKGHNGGYRLARPARSITLLEVVEAVEGPVRGVAPAVSSREHAWFNARLQTVCDAVAERVRRRLGRVSVADQAAEKDG
jgi:Rrf2 family protein